MPVLWATSPSGILPSSEMMAGVQLMDLGGRDAGMPSF